MPDSQQPTLVERLLANADSLSVDGILMFEAADEIERVQASNERKTKRIEELVGSCETEYRHQLEKQAEIERLQEKLRQLHRKIVTTTCPTCSGYQWAMPEGATVCGCSVSSEATEAGGMMSKQQPTFNVGKIRKCSYLLPAPGGDVVRDLLDEIERLQAELDLYQPELTTDERAALDALPDDLVNKLWRQSAEAAKKGGDDE